MSKTIIQVDNLWKRYGFPLKPTVRRMTDRIMGKEDPSPEAYGPWALKDIGFEVKQGEILGVVGRNGAGKSTLLKVLAGVTLPTRGKYYAKGKIFPMIELTAGMNHELTGYENIYLLGAMMGLSRQSIKAGMNAIAEFSELGDWLSKPARMYSSGMLVRLGFAVAVNVNADILLVDEVLAVGDIVFRTKCYEYIRNLQKNGTTVLFVSHTLSEVRRICDRAILIDKGELLIEDTTDRVLMEYVHRTQETDININLEHIDTAMPDNLGLIRLSTIEVFDKKGKKTNSVLFHQPARLRVAIDVMEPSLFPKVYIGFHKSTDKMLAFASYTPSEEATELPKGQTFIDCHIEKLPLVPGEYKIYAMLEDHTGSYRLAQVRNIGSIEVLPNPDDPVNLLVGHTKIDAKWQPAPENALPEAF